MRKLFLPAVLSAALAAAACGRATPTEARRPDPTAIPRFDGSDTTSTQNDTTRRCSGMIGSGTCQT